MSDLYIIVSLTCIRGVIRIIEIVFTFIKSEVENKKWLSIEKQKEKFLKKIVLLCSGGMSTSVLAKKMQEVADKAGLEATITAHGVSQVIEVAHDVDVILLGPQIRYTLEKIKGQLPDVPVAVIDMKDYGKMNSQSVIESAKKMWIK